MSRMGLVLVVLILQLSLSARPAACAVDPAVIEAENRRIALVERVAPAVVSIFGADSQGGGSGVLISADGYTLTNFHVISGAGNFMKCGLNDGQLYDAVIVGIDPTGDVALIKLLGRADFPHLPLGDSDRVALGDWVYAMGNPFLLATDFQPTVTYGIVSGLHRYQYPAGTFLEYTDCIQVDASINPGNSGGPLINEQGELIGINGRASFEKRGRVNIGAAYAISINQIKHFMGALRGGRIVDHASLGATVSSGPDGTVFVDDILEQSEPYRRGLRIDDEIVSFAGRPIRSANQFKNILGIYPDGWKVPIVYRREHEKREILVRLSPLHRETELMRQPQQRRHPIPGRRPRPGDDKQPDDRNEDDQKPDRDDDQQPDKRSAPPDSDEQQASDEQQSQQPEPYQHMYVARRGYANYYFNQLEQDRMLEAIRALGPFGDKAESWKLTGKTASGEPFEFNLTNEFLSLEIGNRPFLQLLDREPQDEPPQTGGLLYALHHFRLLLTCGREGLGEVWYVGNEPLDGRGPLVDVLATTLDGIECHWYVAGEERRLIGFDTWLADNVDACEVRFQKLGSIDGKTMPSQMAVRHADRLFADFYLEHVETNSSGRDGGSPGDHPVE